MVAFREESAETNVGVVVLNPVSDAVLAVMRLLGIASSQRSGANAFVQHLLDVGRGRVDCNSKKVTLSYDLVRGGACALAQLKIVSPDSTMVVDGCDSIRESEGNSALGSLRIECQHRSAGKSSVTFCKDGVGNSSQLDIIEVNVGSSRLINCIRSELTDHHQAQRSASGSLIVTGLSKPIESIEFRFAELHTD